MRRAAAILGSLLAVAAGAAAQQPIVPVDFRPFTDGRHWIVKEPLIYIVGASKESVTVPVGSVTDLASIPPALQSLIQQNGSYLLPAVVHDYLYWKQTCTRAQADGIFRLAMIEHKVSRVHQTAIFQAVRAAGEYAWAGNAQERAARRPRIIPPEYLKIPANVSWEGYQQQLVAAGVAEGPDRPVSRTFCARGGMSIERALRP
jgi:hypothetical protein